MLLLSRSVGKLRYISIMKDRPILTTVDIGDRLPSSKKLASVYSSHSPSNPNRIDFLIIGAYRLLKMNLSLETLILTVL